MRLRGQRNHITQPEYPSCGIRIGSMFEITMAYPHLPCISLNSLLSASIFVMCFIQAFGRPVIFMTLLIFSLSSLPPVQLPKFKRAGTLARPLRRTPPRGLLTNSSTRMALVSNLKDLDYDVTKSSMINACKYSEQRRLFSCTCIDQSTTYILHVHQEILLFMHQTNSSTAALVRGRILLV